MVSFKSGGKELEVRSPSQGHDQEVRTLPRGLGVILEWLGKDGRPLISVHPEKIAPFLIQPEDPLLWTTPLPGSSGGQDRALMSHRGHLDQEHNQVRQSRVSPPPLSSLPFLFLPFPPLLYCLVLCQLHTIEKMPLKIRLWASL